jgi:hypothetical protein
MMTMIVAACTLLVSCQSFKGAFVPDDRRLMLSGTEQQGVFETNDLSLGYRYRVSGDMLHLDGDLDLRKWSVVSFVLQIYFLDESGKVMGSTPVVAANSGGTRRFTWDGKVPAGARSFAFGYSGDTNRTEMGSVPFWYYPMSSASS